MKSSHDLKEKFKKLSIALVCVAFIFYTLWFIVDLSEHYFGFWGMFCAFISLVAVNSLVVVLCATEFTLLFNLFFSAVVFYGLGKTLWHECAFSSEFIGFCSIGQFVGLVFVCIASIFAFKYFTRIFRQAIENSHRKIKFLTLPRIMLVIFVIGLICGARSYLSIRVSVVDFSDRYISIHNGSIFPYYVGLFPSDSIIRLDSHYIFCKNNTGKKPFEEIPLENGFLLPFSTKEVLGMWRNAPGESYFTAGWLEDTCYRIGSSKYYNDVAF
jgi:hypothetical protein